MSACLPPFSASPFFPPPPPSYEEAMAQNHVNAAYDNYAFVPVNGGDGGARPSLGVVSFVGSGDNSGNVGQDSGLSSLDSALALYGLSSEDGLNVSMMTTPTAGHGLR